MRIINRDIVGGFIFSKDGKLLLGKNRKGGVYEGQFTVPAGGSENGETREETLYREIKEETGINISNAKISELHTASGESEKTLGDEGERVLVKMNFYDFKIELAQNAEDVIVKTESDWYEPTWFNISELVNANICEPTFEALITTGIIEKRI